MCRHPLIARWGIPKPNPSSEAEMVRAAGILPLEHTICGLHDVDRGPRPPHRLSETPRVPGCRVVLTAAARERPDILATFHRTFQHLVVPGVKCRTQFIGRSTLPDVTIVEPDGLVYQQGVRAGKVLHEPTGVRIGVELGHGVVMDEPFDVVFHDAEYEVFGALAAGEIGRTNGVGVL